MKPGFRFPVSSMDACWVLLRSFNKSFLEHNCIYVFISLSELYVFVR